MMAKRGGPGSTSMYRKSVGKRQRPVPSLRTREAMHASAQPAGSQIASETRHWNRSRQCGSGTGGVAEL